MSTTQWVALIGYTVGMGLALFIIAVGLASMEVDRLIDKHLRKHK